MNTNPTPLADILSIALTGGEFKTPTPSFGNSQPFTRRQRRAIAKSLGEDFVPEVAAVRVPYTRSPAKSREPAFAAAMRSPITNRKAAEAKAFDDAMWNRGLEKPLSARIYKRVFGAVCGALSWIDLNRLAFAGSKKEFLADFSGAPSNPVS